MKPNHKIIAVIVLIIAISFIGGYMSNSGKYDIVDTQDELTELFNTAQADMLVRDEAVKNLEAKFLLMQEMETLSEADNATMESIPGAIQELNKEILTYRINLGNLQFTYQVLQDMR